jgi:hypothetical protein
MRPLSIMAAGPINLDHPGTYLHWSIFTVSVANLVLIAVMVVIFGAALLLPFPKGRTYPPSAAQTESTDPDGQAAAGSDEDAGMWTNRVRRFATRVLPPGKLLPDRQPAYVASWIYVFGVGSLAAFGVVVVSGFALALGGPDWWHYNSLGHFFNSLHLWSVELFMALLVIHLWGKFWMAAWRGRRAWTWITGMVAFLASVVECFFSAASCTTNCVVPMAKVLQDSFGLHTGLMTTIHAYTGDQMLLDGPHKDLRRARSAAVSIVPTSTGAARTAGLVVPDLAGRLDGVAVRVPVEDGSLTDLTAVLAREVTAGEVNDAFEQAAKGSLSGVLKYSADPLVSRDIIGDPSSCVFDSGLTQAAGALVKIFGWYDNEWGYTCRLADLAGIVGSQL